MNSLEHIAVEIISAQEQLIGPVAISQAESISGIKLSWGDRIVNITGNAEQVIDELVQGYKELFGALSVDVSKEAAHRAEPNIEARLLPQSLR